MISPFSVRGKVATSVYDHCSVLKMIEWRYGLPHLTVRDNHAVNLARVMNFSAANTTAPQWPVPQGPFEKVCSLTAATQSNEWEPLATSAALAGWTIY